MIGSSDIVIEAAPELVWKVLTTFRRWPSWNPDVKSVSMRGAVLEGSEFHWTARPGTIRSTIRHVDAPHRIAWTGRTMGITAIHAWELEPLQGKTLVRTQESFAGLIARIARGSLQRVLDKALADGLRYLKDEAEQRAARQLRAA